MNIDFYLLDVSISIVRLVKLGDDGEDSVGNETDEEKNNVSFIITACLNTIFLIFRFATVSI